MKNHQLNIQLIHAETQKGIAGLRLEAWDKDNQIDDLLGDAISDEQGRLQISFDESTYSDKNRDKAPDVYFKIYQGQTLIKSTEESLMMNLPGDLRDAVVTLTEEELSLPVYSLEGKVSLESKASAAGMQVQIYQKGFSTEKQVASVLTDPEGNYKASFHLEGKAPALYADVIPQGDKKAVHTSATIMKPQSKELLNLSVSQKAYSGESHWRVLNKKIEDGFKEVALDKLNSEDIVLLAAEMGTTEKELGQYVLASAKAKDWKVPAEVAFAMLEDTDETKERLLDQVSGSFEEKLEQAMADRRIGKLSEKQLGAYAKKLEKAKGTELLEYQPAGKLSLSKVLDNLSGQKQLTFASLWQENANTATFWNRLKASKKFSAKEVKNLEFSVQAANLVGDKREVFENLRGQFDKGKLNALSDLVSFSEKDWHDLAKKDQNGDTIYYIDKKNKKQNKEARKAYVKGLQQLIETTFPSQVFMKSMESQKLFNSKDIKAFAANNPGFELGSQPIDQYLEANKAALKGVNDKAFVDKLKTANRLFSLSLNAGGAAAGERLMAMNLTSGGALIDKGWQKFSNEYISRGGSPKEARTIYAHAANTHGLVQHLLTGFGTSKNGEAHVTNSTAVTDIEEGIPTIAEIFGEQSYCDCKHCRSVLSPAAYFVDILQFLEKKPTLNQRVTREDFEGVTTDLDVLWQNLLAAGYIDEDGNVIWEDFSVMEERFIRGGFLDEDGNLLQAAIDSGGETLLLAVLIATSKSTALKVLLDRRPDLAHILLDCKNTNTPMPYIDLVNEVLEHAAMDVAGRAEEINYDRLQTQADKSELLIAPEHPNETVYKEILPAAIDLYQLPYDYYGRQANTTLSILNKERYELMSMLFTENGNWAETDIVNEKLGINDAERALLLTNLLIEADLRDVLLLERISVSQFLELAELNYELLEELLSYAYIDPNDQYYVSFAGDDCNLNTASLLLGSAGVDLMQRIVQLRRLATKLGWSWQTLADALKVHAGAGLTPEVLAELAGLKEVTQKSGLTVSDALCLLGRMPAQLYQEEFLEKDHLKPFAELFESLNNGDQLDFGNAIEPLSIALKINHDDLQLLIRLMGNPTALGMEGLSKLYGLTRLMAVLRLDAQALVYAYNIWAIDPTDSVESLLQFLRIESQESVNPEALHYILNHSPVLHSVDTAALLERMNETLDRVAAESEGLSDEEIRANQSAELQLLLAEETDLAAGVLQVMWLGLKVEGTPIGTVLTVGEEDNDRKEALDRLLKVHFILTQLSIGEDLLNYFINHTDGLVTWSVSAENPASLEQWQELSLTSRFAGRFAKGNTENLITYLTENHGLDRTTSELAALTGWDVADLEFLTEHLTLSADKLKDIQVLTALTQLFDYLFPISTPISSMMAWLRPQLDQDALDSLQMAVKRNIAPSNWARQLREPQDELREERRDALLAYLLKERDDLNSKIDVFGHYLIDPEMSSCMLTSRIKQAISSVQLFIQRSLLNLERPAVFINTTDREAWKNWSNVKNYRVWEASRQIFMYPENWLDPVLRSDRTELFDELSDELLQGELNATTAEKAYLGYVQNLSELSSLEIMSHWKNDEDDVYVLGRTRSEPRKYYFRKRHTGLWSTWQHLDIGISGEHPIIAEFNHELFILWIDIQRKTAENNRPGHFDLTIKLFWSKYKAGEWTEPKVANEPLLTTTSRYDKDLTFTANYTGGLIKINGYIGSDDMGLDHRKLYQLGYWYFDLGEGFVFQTEETDPDNPIKLYLPFRVKLEYNRLVTPIPDRDQNYIPNLVHNGTHLLTNRGNSPFELSVQFYQSGDSLLLMRDDLFFQDRTRSLFFEKEGNAYQAYMFYHPFVNLYFKLIAKNGVHQALRQSTRIISNSYTGNFDDLTIREEFMIKHYGSAITGNDRNFELGEVLDFDYQTIQEVGRFLVNKGYLIEYDTGFSDDVFIRESVSAMTLEEFDLEGAPVDLEPYKEALLNRLKASKGLEHIYFPYPNEEFEFLLGRPFAVYNWELFYHIPLLIASQLQEQRQFEAAQQWFHLMFNPLEGASASDDRLAYWKIKPLMDAFQENGPKSIRALLSNNGEGGIDLNRQIAAWRNNPFDPNLIASMRFNAFQKAVVMKYLGNLFAWGDSLFALDSIESINEATQLYLLISHLLGERPEGITGKESLLRNYEQLRRAGLDDFSNAQTLVEDILGSTLERNHHGSLQEDLGEFSLETDFRQRAENVVNNLDQGQLEERFRPENENEVPDAVMPDFVPSDLENADPDLFVILKSLYFCIPANGQFLEQWSLVADRLFKIRNCQSLDGLTRQLALFEPPIDPGQLINALAGGGSIADFLSHSAGQANQYRFSYLLQKAKEFTKEVQALGRELLSAIEKQDVEGLRRLRAANGLNLLKEVEAQRKQQIEESEKSVETLLAGKELAKERENYYGSKEKLSIKEKQEIWALKKGKEAGTVAKVLNYLAKYAYLIADTGMSGGAPTYVKGGKHIGGSLALQAKAINIGAEMSNFKAKIFSMKAGYERRYEDWKFQELMAKRDMDQIDKQIAVAELRVEMAEKALEDHKLQIEQAKLEEDHLKSQFNDDELYGWMKQQLSTLYFQSYKMAHKLAIQANQALQHELHIDDNLVEANYWNSQYKGLLAGEQLYHDLQKMEVAYMNKNERDFELTKHIALSAINPRALEDLKTVGETHFHLPIALFDLDFPGHYLRRIKSVSISIPGVVGPYSNVPATLTLLSSRSRTKASTLLDADLDTLSELQVHGKSAIATSSGQNDAGVFVLNFNEERYLPFEYAGVESDWKLQLPNDFRPFDYDTITDVVLHINYTAKDAGDAFRERVTENLRTELRAITTMLEESISSESTDGLHKVFDLERDFQSEFYQVVKQGQKTAFEISIHDRFPFLFRTQNMNLTHLSLELTIADHSLNGEALVNVNLPGNAAVALEPFFGEEGKVTFESEATESPALVPGAVTFDLAVLEEDIASISKAVLIVDYEVNPRT